jgi:hypothetical protein
MEAIADNGTVVSAAHLLPGGLPGAVGVAADESCPREAEAQCHLVFPKLGSA